MLEYALGFAILTAFFLLGKLLSGLGFPIPGGVLGMMLFYLALTAGVVKLKWVERAAGLLLRNMVLMFVPLTVGLMEMGPVLSRQAVAITASLLVSLTAVLLTTGLLGRWLLPALPLDETPEDGNSQKTPVKRPSGAKALVDSADVMRELKPPSPSESSFFAACANQTTEAGQ